MKEKEVETKKHLTQKEYSVLVSSVCFSVIVLAVIGIGAYKLVRVVLGVM